MGWKESNFQSHLEAPRPFPGATSQVWRHELLPKSGEGSLCFQFFTASTGISVTEPEVGSVGFLEDKGLSCFCAKLGPRDIYLPGCNPQGLEFSPAKLPGSRSPLQDLAACLEYHTGKGPCYFVDHLYFLLVLMASPLFSLASTFLLQRHPTLSVLPVALLLRPSTPKFAREHKSLENESQGCPGDSVCSKLCTTNLSEVRGTKISLLGLGSMVRHTGRRKHN